MATVSFQLERYRAGVEVVENPVGFMTTLLHARMRVLERIEHGPQNLGLEGERGAGTILHRLGGAMLAQQRTCLVGLARQSALPRFEVSHRAAVDPRVPALERGDAHGHYAGGPGLRERCGNALDPRALASHRDVRVGGKAHAWDDELVAGEIVVADPDCDSECPPLDELT